MGESNNTYWDKIMVGLVSKPFRPIHPMTNHLELAYFPRSWRIQAVYVTQGKMFVRGNMAFRNPIPA
jgi:uncharacterized membrane protein